MGIFSDLFGVEEPEKEETYEQRMAREAARAGIVHSAEQEGESGLAKSPKDDPFFDESGQKIIPEVRCEQLDPHLSGHEAWLELWATVHNTSQFKIRLREFNVLGQPTRPGRYLEPGEKYELRVYHGLTPKDESKRDVVIRYEIVDNGDYFESRGDLDFRQEGEYCVPYRYKETHPARDI